MVLYINILLQKMFFTNNYYNDYNSAMCAYNYTTITNYKSRDRSIGIHRFLIVNDEDVLNEKERCILESSFVYSLLKVVI